MLYRTLLTASKTFILLLVFCSPVLLANTEGETANVVMETGAGTIEIEVYTGRAPLSAGSFLSYVDQKLYQGAAFYRVVRQDNDNGNPKIEVIQGGITDPKKALPAVAHETTKDTGILHTDGVVSLARDKPGTGGGAAFFICIGNQPGLDFGNSRNADMQGFAAFGRVTRGMDVVRAIQKMDASAPSDSEYTAGQILVNPVKILNAYRK